MFTDLAGAIGDNSDYFLGTIVTIPRENGILEVVDGQQRLATTGILLSAVRNYADQIDEDLLVEAIQNYFLTGIDLVNRSRIPRLTLNASDNVVFSAIVKGYGEAAIPQPSQQSHRLLIDACKSARDYVQSIVGPYGKRDHGNRLNAWVDYLESKAQVVHLRVPNDSDAYRMFETLNDRGLRTSQADLIKNYLFGRSGRRLREVQDRWAYVRGTLESLDDNDITVTFLRHALIVLRGYLREAEIYSSVQDLARSENNAVQFATHLDQLATAYAATFNPAHENWNSLPDSTRSAIRVLNILNIRLNNDDQFCRSRCLTKKCNRGFCQLIRSPPERFHER